MKVVGLSGAQGGGKSSLLLELAARGWRLDAFRVSRAVQAQLGWASLERVMDAPETMMQFQEAVFQQKFLNDMRVGVTDTELEPKDLKLPVPVHPKDRVVLTERTFADICAYTMHWTWRFVDDGRLTVSAALDFLSPYVARCADAQHAIYDGTMLLPLMDHIPLENDPHRAVRGSAESVYYDITRFMDRKVPLSHPRLTITGQTVVERADQVEAFLKGI